MPSAITAANMQAELDLLKFIDLHDSLTTTLEQGGGGGNSY